MCRLAHLACRNICVSYISSQTEVRCRGGSRRNESREGAGRGSVWQHMRKTSSLRTASWNLPGILIGTRLFPLIWPCMSGELSEEVDLSNRP